MGGSDGLVTILKFEEEAFQCLYSLDEHLASPVKSISLVGNDVILGDDGANIKVLRWKSGRHNSTVSAISILVSLGYEKVRCM